MGKRRDVTVSAAAGVARASGGTVRVLITSNFDIKWFQIAVEHKRDALAARDRAIAAADGNTEMGEAFDDELKAAMVAIAAAAFAIDAMYRKLDDLLDVADRSRAKGLDGRIVETFKTALALGRRGHEWQTLIPALFEQRGELVHFKGKPHESLIHPTGKAAVSRENVIFTAEATTHAVDLALEVLTTAYTSPRREHRAIVEWSQQAAHVAPYLASQRAGTR